MFLVKKFKIFLLIVLLGLASCSRDKSSDSKDENSSIQKKVKWKMASTFSGSLTQLGTLGVRFQDQIAKVSNNNIKIKFFDPGALVPALEIFDAVSSGSIDAGWSTPGY